MIYNDLAVKNIARPVRVYRVGSAETPEQPALPATALPPPDKPSIAVMPFTNMSVDPEQEFVADGTAEDIITALSRYPSLFVVARNSSFTYRNQAIDVKRVGRELGVRYVLEGSLRKLGNRIRITAQLVEAESGKHVREREVAVRAPLRAETGIFGGRARLIGRGTTCVTPCWKDKRHRGEVRDILPTSNSRE